MADDNIGDFELESLRTYMDGKLDRLREEMIERIQAGLDELEKRTLLRTAGGVIAASAGARAKPNRRSAGLRTIGTAPDMAS